MRVIPILSACLLATGCAYTLNKANAMKFAELGQAAEQSWLWDDAELQYQRAIGPIELGNGPPIDLSWTTYNLGRARGYICKFDEAKQLLERALVLEDSAPEGTDVHRTMRLGELARLHYDRGLYEESLPYYERLLPLARAIGVPAQAPREMAHALDEYAHAQRAAGQGDRGGAATSEAGELRAASPGEGNTVAHWPYSFGCAQTSYRRGDWATAAQLLAVLRTNSSADRTPDALRGLFLLEYGRALGVTCRFDEARATLTESSELFARSQRPLFMALSELGRLELQQKRHPEAVAHFERLEPELEPNQVRAEPGYYAAIRSDYASALDAIGQAERASQQRALAAQVTPAPADVGQLGPTPYGTQCAP